jgi:hypothetical protein
VSVISEPPGPGQAAVLRPDGRVQVGLGPGALLVEGWTAPAPPVDHLLRTAPAAGPTGLTSCRVSGHGQLADRLASELARPGDPTRCLLVLVREQVVAVDEGVHAASAGVTALPVVRQAQRVVVGPVTGLGGPCLHCLDLHRRDRDRHWPVVAAQLTRPAALPPAAPVMEEVDRAAGAVVLLLARTLLTGGPVTPGLAYELGPRAPHLVTRRWATHPGCRWHDQDG